MMPLDTQHICVCVDACKFPVCIFIGRRCIIFSELYIAQCVILYFTVTAINGDQYKLIQHVPLEVMWPG